MADHLLAFGWAGLVFAIWFALAVGSFLNVVIYRMPVMLKRQWERDSRALLELPVQGQLIEPFNLWVPRSRCPACGTQISALHNVPVLSWLALRGRCAYCGNAISARYPLIEILTCVASLAVIALFGFTWLGLAAVLFTWVLIAATFIDFDTQLLPDQLTLPLVWLGLLTNHFGGFTDLGSAVIGAVVGYLFLWGTYWGFKLLTGKEGMGYGDFKLFAAIGAWLGWQVLPGAVLIASVAGLVYAGISMVTSRLTRSEPIPFGPFLAIAGWVCLLFRDTVLAFFAG